MVGQPEAKRKKVAIIVFVVAQLIVAGLLWVVFSGTGDREERVKTALAIANAGKIEDAVANYYRERGALPADNNALRLPDKQAKPYLADLDEHADPSYTATIASGVITLTFSANQEPVSGKTLVFVPRVYGEKLEWSCDTGSVEAIYRPPQCGGQQT